MDPSACFTVSHHTIAPKVRSTLRQAELPLPNQSQGSRASQGNTSALALTGSVALLARYLHRQQRSRGTQVHAVGPVVAAAAAAAKVAAAGKFAAAGAGAAGVAAGIKTMSEGRRVLVLGTGWGSVTFLQGLSEDISNYYDITVVSPRNFFLYTPLLPASTMGSIEERSIVTPIRRVIKGKADFLEAKCEEIDIENKTVKCTRAGTPDFSGDVDYEHFPADDVPHKMEFNINYDILIYGVGAQTNTFRTPGVEEHAFFFKELSDARKVREKVTELFERASLPTSTETQKKRWLSFVVVGGGPTGVEVAADMADFITGDAAELYPKLMDYVKVKLVNTGDFLLSTYDRGISQKCIEIFEEKGVEVLAGYRVTEITKKEIQMKKKDGEAVALEYGCVVWAAGIRQNELTNQLKDSLIKLNEGVSDSNVNILKTPANGIITDDWLQVRGSGGSIYALGDAASVRHERTSPYADSLFQAADLDNSGDLTLTELRDLFQGASDEFPQLEEYAQYLSAAVEEDNPRVNAIAKVFGEALERERQAWKKAKELVSQRASDRTKRKGSGEVEKDFTESDANSNKVFDLEDSLHIFVGCALLVCIRHASSSPSILCTWTLDDCTLSITISATPEVCVLIVFLFLFVINAGGTYDPDCGTSTFYFDWPNRCPFTASTTY
ncbi:NDB1 [Symbiodinium sp. CCMP2592]|nr:NDB1 [Symbiodinium sp. CCMP2592]